MADARWIFAYGSLVWRPSFPFERRAPASIRGFARRFWQGSPDHRGVPEAPGRVVTLTRAPGVRCEGVAYRVAAREWPAVVEGLDRRESGGFERLEVPLEWEGPPARALVYVAWPHNPNFLGPAPAREIAEQVQRSRGQSGPNSEYVLELADALAELGVEDPHVREIAALLGAALPGPSRSGARSVAGWPGGRAARGLSGPGAPDPRRCATGRPRPRRPPGPCRRRR